MEEIFYEEINWDEIRDDAIDRDITYKYNPRLRGEKLDVALEVNFIWAIRAYEVGYVEIAQNRIDTGLKYIEKIAPKKTPLRGMADYKTEELVSYYFAVYYFSWFNNQLDKESVDKLKDCLKTDYISKIRGVPAYAKEQERKKNIFLCARFGEFDLAKEKLLVYRNIGQIDINDNSIIYNFLEFYYAFVSFMLGEGDISRDRMEELFLEIICEHQKGNRTIFFEYTGLAGIYEIYYLYYKYIVQVPEEELTASNVYRSGEKGILHWRK